MVKKNLVNIASLAAVQGSNAVLPIAIFPYLLAVFGAEKYSVLVVSEAVSLIILAFVIFSFEVNGVTAVINSNREQGSAALSLIYSEIFYSRVLIWLCCLCLVLGAWSFVDLDFSIALLLWMLVPLGYIFQSSFFFLAVEENLPLAVFVAGSRAVCAAAVFICIDQSSPLFLAPAIVGSCYFIGGLLCFAYVTLYMKVRLFKPTFSGIRDRLHDGKEIFLGNLSVVLTRDSNVLILNLVGADSIAISAYSVAEKLIKSFQASIRPLNQFFFARTIVSLKGIVTPGREAFFRIARLTYVQLLTLLLMFIGLSVFYAAFHDAIPFLASFPNKDLIATLFVVMVAAVFFGVSNYMFGTAGLNNLNAKRYFATALIVSGMVTVSSCVILVHFFGVYGASISFVLGEMILFLFLFHKYILSPVK